MKPSQALAIHRREIRRIVEECRARNPRVFGSALRGQDTEMSDLDLLVDPIPGTTLFDLGGLQVSLEELLGIEADLFTPGDLPERVRERVLREAVPRRSGTPCARLRGRHEPGFVPEDRRTQQAVVLNLMTIGEAAARIANEYTEFAAAHPAGTSAPRQSTWATE